MNIKPLSIEILDFLKKFKNTWYWGGELERRLSVHHKPSTVGRVLRSLAEEGQIYKRLEKVGKVNAIQYKSK